MVEPRWPLHPAGLEASVAGMVTARAVSPFRRNRATNDDAGSEHPLAAPGGIGSDHCTGFVLHPGPAADVCAAASGAAPVRFLLVGLHRELRRNAPARGQDDWAPRVLDVGSL